MGFYLVSEIMYCYNICEVWSIQLISGYVTLSHPLSSVSETDGLIT